MNDNIKCPKCHSNDWDHANVGLIGAIVCTDCGEIYMMKDETTMTNKPTRQEMIEALTHYEFQWLIDNPDYLSEVTEFFCNGGFYVYTDESLVAQYERNISEEVTQ